MKHSVFLTTLESKIEASETVYRLSTEEIEEITKILSKKRTTEAMLNRCDAAKILGMVETTQWVEETLVSLLKDTSWVVRAEASESLGYNSTSRKSFEALMDAITIEKNQVALHYMIYAIPFMVDDDTLETSIVFLEKMIEDGKHYRTKNACYYALIMMQEEHYLEYLFNQLHSKNAHKIESAVVTLKNIVEDEDFEDDFLYSKAIISEINKISEDIQKEFKFNKKLLSQIKAYWIDNKIYQRLNM